MILISFIMFLIIGVCAFFVVKLTATQEYITYREGEAAIILTSPHGGYLEPSAIPDRDYGCLVDGGCVYTHTCGQKDTRRCRTVTSRDGNTKELTLLLEEELINRGLRPYVVINNLARVKLDANRDREQATFLNEIAVEEYDRYTSYINEAKSSIQRGVLFDIHGVRTHEEDWIEVGYRISKTQLNEDSFEPEDSSIRALAARVCGSDDDCFDDLLRGETSFGEMLSNQEPGRPVVPSIENPRPGVDGGYYRGGYTTETHGSIMGGEVDAIQIESPASLRGEDTTPEYAVRLAAAIAEFYNAYYAEQP